MIEGYDHIGNLIERWTHAGYERWENGQVVETRPLTDMEARQVIEVARATTVWQDEQDRQAALAAPLTPAPIEGTTVEEVKASAEASLADLATQMQAKIDAILGGV